MSTTSKIVAALIVTLAIVGSYFFPSSEGILAGASPTGTTFSTQKLATIVFAPATTAATTTFLLNTDANDRIVEQAVYSCSGLTAVNNGSFISTGFQFYMSTSSTAVQTGNSNYVLITSVPTTTPELFVASTTPGLTATAAFRRWAAGSYLQINANASTTASCVIGVNYLAS